MRRLSRHRPGRTKSGVLASPSPAVLTDPRPSQLAGVTMVTFPRDQGRSTRQREKLNGPALVDTPNLILRPAKRCHEQPTLPEELKIETANK